MATNSQIFLKIKIHTTYKMMLGLVMILGLTLTEIPSNSQNPFRNRIIPIMSPKISFLINVAARPILKADLMGLEVSN